MTEKLANKNVIVDIDGVVLDFLTGWEKKSREILKRDIKQVGNDFDLSKRYNLTKEETDEIWSKFCWETLDVFDGAEKAITILKNNGFNVHFVTSVCESKKDERIKNLLSHSIPCDSITFVGFQGEKNEIIDLLDPIAFFDDLIDNIEAAHESNVPHIHMVNHHNIDENHNNNISYHLHGSLLDAVELFMDNYLKRHAPCNKARVF